MSRYRLRYCPKATNKWQIWDTVPTWKGGPDYEYIVDTFCRRKAAERELALLREVNEGEGRNVG